MPSPSAARLLHAVASMRSAACRLPKCRQGLAFEVCEACTVVEEQVEAWAAQVIRDMDAAEKRERELLAALARAVTRAG